MAAAIAAAHLLHIWNWPAHQDKTLLCSYVGLSVSRRIIGSLSGGVDKYILRMVVVMAGFSKFGAS